MEVILQEDYPQLGYVGDRVNVRNGFARNFLIPKGIAFEAGSRNARELEHRLKGVLAKRKKRFAEAQALGKEVSQVALNFKLKMGEKGKSFGSVTSRDIHSAFEAAGHVLDRKQIRLLESIKAPGKYFVEVKLHSEVVIKLPVSVEGERVSKKSEEPELSAEANSDESNSIALEQEIQDAESEELVG